MTDPIEPDLRAMLRRNADQLPHVYEPPSGLTERVARRRRFKIALASAGTLALVIVGAVAVSAAVADGKHPRVETTNPTNVPGPTTPTTRVTTTTTAPVPLTSTVESMGCPTVSVSAPFAVPAPAVVAREVRGLERSIANRVRSFVGPRAGASSDPRTTEPDVVLGPRGWSCQVYRSNGGGAVMYVYPPSAQSSFGSSDASWSTSEQYDGPEVRVTTAVLGHDPDAGLACAVFATEPLVQQWVASSPVATRCVLPNGRRLERLGPGAYAFTDADGTRGVGVMRVRATSPRLDGDYGIVTCRLAAPDAGLCDAIINDYVTRYPGSVPVSQPTLPTHRLGGVVTTDGHVGTLQFGTSTEADVRSTAGAPGETARASFLAPGATSGSPNLPDYDALGYDCTPASTPGRTPLVVQPALHGPYCATIYFINVATKTLAAFETTAVQYRTERATIVGMTPAEAQLREGHALIPHACVGSSIQLGSLYQNGSATTAAALFIFVGPGANDRVRSIEAESNVNPVGMLFC